MYILAESNIVDTYLYLNINLNYSALNSTTAVQLNLLDKNFIQVLDKGLKPRYICNHFYQSFTSTIQFTPGTHCNKKKTVFL